jgi:hypothetical protein
MLFSGRPGSLKAHACFASPHTFDNTAETDMHDDRVMEVGSQSSFGKDSTLPVGGARLSSAVAGLT